MSIEWKSVPVIPTDDMDIAGIEASLLGRASVDDETYVRSIYKAMLDAAPNTKVRHYCPDWDFALISRDDPEYECCTCAPLVNSR